MEKIFGLDSKFFKYGTIFCDYIIVVILWLFCSIPIITIGASTTALYYVTTRQLSNREGYVTKDFFKSFKSNFIEATGVTLLMGIFLSVVLINIKFFTPDSAINTVLYVLQYVLLYEILAFGIYVFPVLSRFDLKFKELLKTSFFMANRHLLTTFSCALLIIASVLAFETLGILILLCAAAYAFISSLMFMKLFRKYVPDMDMDKHEDKR